LAIEFWRSQNAGDIAVKLTPAGSGRLEIYLDGEKIFDRFDESGEYPSYNQVNELKMVVAERVFDVEDEMMGTGN
jgi:predicted Rdx family selenoprotein